MYKADKAIIMAAGKGMRMRPLTLETPKPLVKVNGRRMIETIIEGLRENEITQIYVVVGKLKEKFKFLEMKYPGLVLIENPYYDGTNSISSMYVARDHLENAFVLDGDQLIRNPKILNTTFQKSGYNAAYRKEGVSEWIAYIDDDDIITRTVISSTKPGWQLLGISRWSPEDGKRLRKHIEYEFEQKKNRGIYWDNIALFEYADEYKLKIWKQENYKDIIEIDSILELAALDESYKPLLEEINNMGE